MLGHLRKKDAMSSDEDAARGRLVSLLSVPSLRRYALTVHSFSTKGSYGLKKCNDPGINIASIE